MKRRSFTFGLAAATAAPAVPLSVSIAPATTGAAQHFTLAKLLARTHNHCTPDMLARHLKVSKDMAQSVQNLLVNRGVITPPVAGASMAVNPLNTHCITNEAMKTTNYLQKAAQLRARLEEVADRITLGPTPEDEDLNTRL
jgi:hypothetical protein